MKYPILLLFDFIIYYLVPYTFIIRRYWKTLGFLSWKLIKLLITFIIYLFWSAYLTLLLFFY